MPRTSTTSKPQISFLSGGTLTFPVPASPKSHASFVLPPGSKFDSELHWHETHTEFFALSRGIILLTLESSSPPHVLKTSFIDPSSGIIEIPRGRRHRLRRGDCGGGFENWMSDVEINGRRVGREAWEDEVRAEEWTDPADGRKESFFRNLTGVVNEVKRGGSWGNLRVEMEVLAVMERFDNWPAFFGDGRGVWVRDAWGGRWLEWVITHIVLAVVSWLGLLVGIKGEYEEYTPRELRLVEGKGRKDL